MAERSGLITALDRCDCRKCGAAAWVRVSFVTGILDFCAHHFAEKADQMMHLVPEVLDERHLILGG